MMPQEDQDIFFLDECILCHVHKRVTLAPFDPRDLSHVALICANCWAERFVREMTPEEVASLEAEIQEAEKIHGPRDTWPLW